MIFLAHVQDMNDETATALGFPSKKEALRAAKQRDTELGGKTK